jgi:microcystin-dependent protein
MPKTRRQFAGGAVASTLTGSVAANGVTTFGVLASTNWSTSTTIPFYVVVSPQTSSEEKMLVTLSSNVLTIVSRGVDGTSANSHSSGATIYPVFTATDANEANELTAKYANRGSIVYQGASTFEELAKGTQGHALVIGANDPAWGQLGTVGIADDAITSAKIAADAVGSSEIAANAVTATEIATDAVTTAKILDANVTTAKILDANVTTAKIADANVTLAKLASAVANALVPVGTITAYAGVTAPTGWLLCNGTSTSGYTTLAALVGATTPDFRGRFLIGDNADLTLLGTGGSTTIATTNLPAHGHAAGTLAAAANSTGITTENGGTHDHSLDTDLLTSTVAHGHGQNGQVMGGTSATPEGTGADFTSTHFGHTHTVTDPTHSHTITGATAETGGAQAYFQPYLVVNYIIKHD